MNIYEVFGLVLVIGMVAVLLIAAHALGDHERTIGRTAERPPTEDKENSPA